MSKVQFSDDQREVEFESDSRTAAWFRSLRDSKRPPETIPEMLSQKLQRRKEILAFGMWKVGETAEAIAADAGFEGLSVRPARLIGFAFLFNFYGDEEHFLDNPVTVPRVIITDGRGRAYSPSGMGHWINYGRVLEMYAEHFDIPLFKADEKIIAV